MSQIQPALCSAEENLESDAVFAKIAEHVKADPDQVKKINGIFIYNITNGGTTKAQWSKYLPTLIVNLARMKMNL